MRGVGFPPKFTGKNINDDWVTYAGSFFIL